MQTECPCVVKLLAVSYEGPKPFQYVVPSIPVMAKGIVVKKSPGTLRARPEVIIHQVKGEVSCTGSQVPASLWNQVTTWITSGLKKNSK